MKKELLKTVVMSNTLTQNAVANFSRIEYLIFLYAVSKVEINDVDFGKITVPIANFCDLFGLKNYDSVRNAVKRLWQERILLNNKKLRVMSACGTNEKNEITIKLHKDLSDYLIGFDKNYTIFNLGYLVGLKSKYSIRLYLLCCSVKNQHIYSNTYTSINLLLNGKYRNPSDIERRILSPADNEINWYSDLYISIKNYNNRLYIFSRLKNDDEIEEYDINEWIIDIKRNERQYDEIAKEIFEDDFSEIRDIDKSVSINCDRDYENDSYNDDYSNEPEYYITDDPEYNDQQDSDFDKDY